MIELRTVICLVLNLSISENLSQKSLRVTFKKNNIYIYRSKDMFDHDTKYNGDAATPVHSL